MTFEVKLAWFVFVFFFFSSSILFRDQFASALAAGIQLEWWGPRWIRQRVKGNYQGKMMKIIIPLVALKSTFEYLWKGINIWTGYLTQWLLPGLLGWIPRKIVISRNTYNYFLKPTSIFNFLCSLFWPNNFWKTIIFVRQSLWTEKSGSIR